MKSVAAFLVALCLAHLHDIDANVKNIRKSYVYPNRNLVFKVESYTDERLTYALCDKKILADDIKCTVIREKKPFEDDSYSCNVTLKRQANSDRKHMPSILIQPFGKNYVALGLSDVNEQAGKYALKFTTVQMDNCKVGEASIDTKSALSFFDYVVVGHSDSYDVFFKNSEVSCAGKTCKATIRADGQLADEPSPSVGNLIRSDYIKYPIFSLDDGSSAKGYFYIAAEGNDYIHYLRKADGTEKSLARHPKTVEGLAVSTKNDLIGVCYQSISEYVCNQYDFEGNSKLQLTISRDNKKQEHLLDLYNTPKGGFYVFSEECIENCIGDNSRHYVQRIYPDGRKSGPTEVRLTFNNKVTYEAMSPLFYVNEAKDICISAAAFKTADDQGRIDLSVNCFTDADFSI